MDIQELSEINFGLIVEGKMLPSAYVADQFFHIYIPAVKILQKGGGKEDLHKVIAPKYVQDAIDAVRSLNGSIEIMNYPGQLVKAYESFELGQSFEKAGGQLKQNKDVDLLPLYGRVTSLVSDKATGLTLARDIDYGHYKPFINSGYKPIDEIIGGIPTDGPIVIYGLTGVGKSHFSSKLASCLLIEHPEWQGACYTLEMSAEHWLYREINMYPAIKKLKDRLYVSGSVRNVEELVAEITIKKLNFVVIDDMDNLVSEQSASEYERVYRRIKEICRFLKIPVILLAQPNRMAKLGKRFLTQYDISWSGAGENSAALLIALQKANELDLDDDLFPLWDDDHDYIMFWKSRDGWPAQIGPGAIILESPTGSQPLWEGQPIKNKLWRPEPGRSIGRGKKEKN